MLDETDFQEAFGLRLIVVYFYCDFAMKRLPFADSSLTI